MILPFKQAAPDLLFHQSQCRARFFQVFARFMHGRVIRFGLTPGNGEGKLDLFPANSGQTVAQRFIAAQFVAHKRRYLLAR